MTMLMHRPRTEPTTAGLIDRVFTDFFDRALPAMTAAQVDEGLLAVDISEDNMSYIVRASLPGFDKNDVDVEVHDGVLTVKAQHTEESEETSERFYRRERRVGSVSRRIALPGAALENETQAELADGVLTVRVPRAKPETPHKVSIN